MGSMEERNMSRRESLGVGDWMTEMRKKRKWRVTRIYGEANITDFVRAQRIHRLGHMITLGCLERC